MNVYLATYFQAWAYGAYLDIHLIIVANTENEALGLALHDNQETIAAKWKLYPLDTTVLSVTQIIRRDES